MLGLKLTVAVSTENLLARLKHIPDLMRRALVMAVTKLSIEVQRGVKEQKLSGQVLHVRSGTLRRSINREVIEAADGVFAIIGTNVKYAAIHEYGGQIHIPPRRQLTYRGLTSEGKLTSKFVKKRQAKFIGIHPASGDGRTITMPERSFLRSTLHDFEPRIRQEIKRAALKVLN